VFHHGVEMFLGVELNKVQTEFAVEPRQLGSISMKGSKGGVR
jgi:hypothetical protein